MKNIYLLLPIIIFNFLTKAQDSAEDVLSKLCAPNMHGRGYVKKGDGIAAKYISKQFKEIGLEPIEKSYFQKFKLDVNTFPKMMELIIDGDTLVPGEQFLIRANSPEITGIFDLVEVELDQLGDETYLRNIFNSELSESTMFKVVQPSTKNRDTIGIYRGLVNELQQIRPVLFVSNQKFMWSVGRNTAKNPVFEVPLMYKSAKNAEIEVDQKFIKNYKSQNVIGMLPSRNKNNSNTKTIVVCGHYDHLGRMGKKAYFPGANDNASGIAMILELAKHFKKKKLDKNIIFIAFGGEEAGLVGSKFFTENPSFPLDQIDFVLNIDIMGSGDEGITMVNSVDQKDAFDKMTKLNEADSTLKVIKRRGQTKNSDHYPFSEKGVPAVFIYTQGDNNNYHDVFDKASEVNMNDFKKVLTLFKNFIARYP